MVDFSQIKNKKNRLLRLRPALRWVLKLRSSPRSIAGGLGLGMFIAFTPTVGIQIILAFLAATLCRVNRAAAIVPVWITNPVTVTPVYTFNYWLGSLIWPGPPLSEVKELFSHLGRALTHLQFWEMKEAVLAMLQIGMEILIPLLIGSIEVGVISGILTYIISLKLLTFFLTRRAEKRLLNNRQRP
ncbi:MAG: DUF2062 domain-containing protein [Proteobacteria bacterium]|nr:DUF2062 domain-containing protein [Pseudomonadota bacterium]